MATLSCSQSIRMNSIQKYGPKPANDYCSMKGNPLNVQNCHELKSLTLGPFLSHENGANVMNVKNFIGGDFNS